MPSAQASASGTKSFLNMANRNKNRAGAFGIALATSGAATRSGSADSPRQRRVGYGPGASARGDASCDRSARFEESDLVVASDGPEPPSELAAISSAFNRDSARVR